MNPPKKIAIIFRVCQQYRVSLLRKLNLDENLDINVFHSTDVKKTKLINTKDFSGFSHVEMFTFKYIINLKDRKIPVLFSPFLIFNLFSYRPDIILVEGGQVNVLNAYLYAFIKKVPIVYWSLGKLRGREKKLRSFLSPLINYLERKAAICLCYSSVAKQYYQSIGIPESKIIVAVNCIDTSEAMEKAQQYKLSKDAMVPKISRLNVLFIGALEKGKNIDKLIQSIKILQDTGINAYLTIIGDGSESECLKKNAEQIDVSKHVHFTGKLLEGKEKYLLSSNVFVLPGLGGLAISEAMAYGLPVICSVADGTEVDLVRPGENGFILKQNYSANELADYLKIMADDSNLVKKFGEESTRIIREEININSLVESIKYALREAQNLTAV